jgi:hypothetical protein
MRTGANRETNARRSTRPPTAEAASRARLCRNTSALTGSCQTYRKLLGQIIVRHMCATGDPSKPNPSVG